MQIDKKLDLLMHVIEDCERQIKEKREELNIIECDLSRLIARQAALYEVKRIFEKE